MKGQSNKSDSVESKVQIVSEPQIKRVDGDRLTIHAERQRRWYVFTLPVRSDCASVAQVRRPQIILLPKGKREWLAVNASASGEDCIYFTHSLMDVGRFVSGLLQRLAPNIIMRRRCLR